MRLELEKIVQLIPFYLISIISIIPILAGLVGAMILAIGISYASVYYFWKILSIIFEFLGKDKNRSLFYFQGFIRIGTNINTIIITISFILALLGLFLFLTGITQIVYAKVHKENVVTSYLYKYIRHPQNLGIILISVAIFLYIPITWSNHISHDGTYWMRIGDFYSIILFILIWLIEAKWEEKYLLKEFHTDYEEYMRITPFIIPFTTTLASLLNERTPLLYKKIPFWIKTLLWILIYFIFIIIYSDSVSSSIYLTR